MSKTIYVHIDTTSNAVLSNGIAVPDFNKNIIHQPKNLLLLEPTTDLGEFESHTGLKVIRGAENIEKFFFQLHQHRLNEEIKWIDFTDIEMIKELSALEISELLYLGHTKNHLHSPFFYKLQNNFVYFDLKENRSRVYYRYLDEFYRILGNKLTQITEQNINHNRSFFKKPITIAPVDFHLLKQLKGTMEEGIIFYFKPTDKNDENCSIPIYLVGDTRFKLAHQAIKEENKIAEFTYIKEKNIWEFVLIEDSLPFGFHTIKD